MTAEEVTKRVVRGLTAVGADARPDRRLAAFLRAYEAETGRALPRPPSDTDLVQVYDWWLEQRKADNFFDLELVGQPRAKKALVSRTVVDKARSLLWPRCGACDYYPGTQEDGGLWTQVVIDVEPWSAQSVQNRVKIRRAVTDDLRSRGTHAPWVQTPMCVSIVTLLPESRRALDVDNVVKGLLDAFSGVLYEDDRIIQCLTTRKVPYKGSVGCYFVLARSVWPWAADVVWDDGAAPRIMSGGRIESRD